MARPKRVLLLGLGLGILLVTFWTLSRYPDLDTKAAADTEAGLHDILSLEPILIAHPNDKLPKQVLYTWINWLDATKKGMLFAFTAAALLLALFKQVSHRGVRNPFLNSLIGMLMGAPLGVCVNCAVPISKGLYESGRKLETSLSVMFSSPSLNIVVLLMLFTMFPLYMALIKVGLTLVLILLFLPLLTKYVFKTEQHGNVPASCEATAAAGLRVNESWPLASKGALYDFGHSLRYILQTTVPWMLVASLLGALVAHLVNFAALADYPISLGLMVILGALGAFLPVPMALDVILAHVTWLAGAPPGYVMVLLFTLGLFSVYSFFIIKKTMSARVAVTLFLVVSLLGIGAGYGAQGIFEWQADKLVRTSSYASGHH